VVRLQKWRSFPEANLFEGLEKYTQGPTKAHIRLCINTRVRVSLYPFSISLSLLRLPIAASLPLLYSPTVMRPVDKRYGEMWLPIIKSN
jgi:hypothetical protein